MTYKQFVKMVQELGLTKEQVRCDVPMTPEVLALIEQCDDIRPGLYETYAMRFYK